MLSLTYYLYSWLANENITLCLINITFLIATSIIESPRDRSRDRNNLSANRSNTHSSFPRRCALGMSYAHEREKEEGREEDCVFSRFFRADSLSGRFRSRDGERRRRRSGNCRDTRAPRNGAESGTYQGFVPELYAPRSTISGHNGLY